MKGKNTMSKSKGYYIIEGERKDLISAYPGVMKKIDQQMIILEEHFEMHTLFLEQKGGKIAKRILPGSRLYQWEKLIKEIRKPVFIYIRKPGLDKGIVFFLKAIKRRYPGTAVILEIPTYPYAKELYSHNIKNYPLYIRDILTHKQLKNYVDRIVTFSEDKEIFGIRTIPIMNGIIVDDIRPKQPKGESSEIHLLAVATFQKYNGYERVIQGMGDYYSQGGDRNIILDLVGSGDVLEEYRELAENLGIQERVRFHGPKYGEEAVPYFHNADIALSVFGCYKNGIFLSSALKIREYLAYGLPIVSGVKEDIFAAHPFPYFLRFKNDPSTVDMKAILRFYDKCYNSDRNCEQLISEIRSYAKKYADMTRTFSPVTDYLLNVLKQQ